MACLGRKRVHMSEQAQAKEEDVQQMQMPGSAVQWKELNMCLETYARFDVPEKEKSSRRRVGHLRIFSSSL